MRTKLYRLLAPEDAATGAAGAPAPTPTPAPAPSPAPAPAFPPEALASIAQQLATTVKDSVFGELRRTGVLDLVGKKPAAGTPPPADSTATPPPATAPDIAAIVSEQVTQRLVIERGLDAYAVSDAAKARARAALAAEKPADTAAWLATYATDMGWSKSAPTPTPNTNPTPTPSPAQGNATPQPGNPAMPPSPTPGGPPPPPPSGVYQTPVYKWGDADAIAHVKKHGHASLLREWSNSVAGLMFPTMRSR